jgi:hypothetical protein
MKPVRVFVVCLVSLLCTLPAFAQNTTARNASGLRIKIECEEPSGVLWDRDTVQSSRAVLFSIHVFNETQESRIVTLTWKVRDAGGNTVLDAKTRYTIAAGAHSTRRELFPSNKRGAFVLVAFAESRADGPDFKTRETFPFTILSAPATGNAARRPLILPDAPLGLREEDLTFLDRIGAHAVRTVIAGEENSPVQTPQQLDAALQNRAAHGIATVGVLVAPPRTALRDDEEWLQASLLLITRYRDIHTWEVVGNPAPDTLSEIARAARNMNPPRSVLAVAPSTLPSQSRTFVADGVLFSPPHCDAVIHLATLRRSFLADSNRTRNLGASAFHVRGIASAPTENALESAGDMVARSVLALAAGAAEVSASLNARGSSQEAETSVRFARGAALAMLVSQLGNAQFHAEAFPTSPVIYAEVFGRGDGGSVAVLWAATDQFGKAQQGKLSVLLADGEVLDLFGNAVTKARSSHKPLEIPLGANPIYLTSAARPEAMLRVLREGTASDVRPLAAQVLPLTQVIATAPEKNPDGKKTDGKMAPPVKTLVRVRLQNIGIRALSGTLEINPPPSWKLTSSTQSFNLEPGQSRIYTFAVEQTKINDKYPIVVKAVADGKSGGGSWGWTQDAPLAVATNIAVRDVVTLDGRLDDWNDAKWMTLGPRGRVSGQLAVRWDQRHLFIAARVKENRLQPRRADELEYAFWQSYDAIQLGLGLREEAWSNAGSGPFRDTDFGFLLCPFHVRPDATVEGRVLRLWGGQLPFGTLPDRVRWGGAVPGARCEIRRDERNAETIYEAMIPLAEMPDLKPETRSANSQQADVPMRFSWILHSDEAGALQWAQQANVFPWWNTTLSFLPTRNTSLAAQTLLGFAQQGEVASGVGVITPAPAPVAPTTTPAPPAPKTAPPAPIPPAPIPPNASPLPLPPAPSIAPADQPELLPYFPPQQ